MQLRFAQEVVNDMRVSMACVLGILLLSSTCAAASASQLLAWGVEEGQEFSFRLQVLSAEYGIILDENMEFKVDSLPDLNEFFAALQRIPIVPVYAHWANGTEIESYHEWYMWVDRLVLPIGDWYLVESYILVETMDDYDSIDSDDFWGFEWSVTLEDVTVVVRTVYYKADGFLSHYSYSESERGADSPRYIIDSARTDIPVDVLSLLSPLSQPLSVISIALAPIALLIVARHRRHIKKRGASTSS